MIDDMDMDLEKGVSSSPSGSSSAAVSLAGEDDLDRWIPCSCGSGPVNSCCRHFTFGLRNTLFVGMTLVSVLFAVLAVFLLPRRPASVAEETSLPHSVSVVWTSSLLLCSYLSLWTFALSRTMGAAAVFFRVSYGALLAFAAAGFVGPVAGMTVAHLTTAWVAGLFGYALAEHRMHAGGERAAAEAAARTPSSRSEGETLTVVHCVFAASLLTLVLGARVVWLVFFPSYGDENTSIMVVELSVLVWTILYFWAFLATPFLLHEALVSVQSMVRLYCYYLASIIISIVCVLVPWLWVYCFGVEMMAMAAFLGYILAVNDHRKDILLARVFILICSSWTRREGRTQL